MYDSAEFISDMKDKHEQGYQFKYVGKQDATPDVPHVAAEGKIYFSMEKN
jgi:hypothetical protein